MLARVPSATLIGIEAVLLTIECDLSPGLPQFHTVGLPDAAVRESADRVRTALRNAGLRLPPRRITVGLAPADLRKQGAALDLPIALGLLAAQGEIPAASLERTLVLGELALDGRLRPVPGCLPATLLARRLGLEAIMVPADNRDEALAVPGPGVHGVASLSEAVGVLRGGREPEREARARFLEETEAPGADLAEVRGQAHARRALEVAAAGGHHLLMIGPPGCGKTMLARRLPGILPPLSLDESIEVSCIYSAAALLPHPGLLRRRPFRAPHHTISGIGLVGGGRGPRPGEVTLAHRGLLFLDELPEFGRGTLDVLRQPLEEGSLVINRAHRTTRLPARFMLVAAMNPCPCGQLGRGDRPCACTPAMVARYRGRVSGPLLDRFEVQVEVGPVRARDLEHGEAGEPSAAVALRVAEARRRRAQRLAHPMRAGAVVASPADATRAPALDRASRRLLGQAINRLGLSARAHDGILRVARTIADLEGAETIHATHLAEAIQYRTLDRHRAEEPG
jgi:magnesium chelatase family protein